MKRFVLALCSAIVYGLQFAAFALSRADHPRGLSNLTSPVGFEPFQKRSTLLLGTLATVTNSRPKIAFGFIFLSTRKRDNGSSGRCAWFSHIHIFSRSAHAVKPLKYQDYPEKRQTIIGESL